MKNLGTKALWLAISPVFVALATFFVLGFLAVGESLTPHGAPQTVLSIASTIVVACIAASGVIGSLAVFRRLEDKGTSQYTRAMLA